MRWKQMLITYVQIWRIIFLVNFASSQNFLFLEAVYSYMCLFKCNMNFVFVLNKTDLFLRFKVFYRIFIFIFLLHFKNLILFIFQIYNFRNSWCFLSLKSNYPESYKPFQKHKKKVTVFLLFRQKYSLNFLSSDTFETMVLLPFWKVTQSYFLQWTLYHNCLKNFQFVYDLKFGHF